MHAVRINLSPRVVQGQRLPAVDELKGLAIGLVIFYHVGGVLDVPNFLHGEIGVDIFLILSGFTLALNSSTLSMGRYATRRVLRIFPSYWIALGLFVWMQRRFYGVKRGWETIIHHIIGIHGFSRLAYFSDVADAFWFISMILAAYVVFGLIRKHLDNLSLVIAVMGVLTAAATFFYLRNGHAGGLISLAVRIPSFFVGVLAGQLLGHGGGEIRFNLLLALGLMCFYYQTFMLGTACNYTLPAMGFVATWVVFRRLLLKVPGGNFVLAAIGFVGVISYEVYLFHQPFIRDYNLYVYHEILRISTPTRSQLLEGVWVALGVTLVLSIVVHRVLGWAFSALLDNRCAPDATVTVG